MELNTAPYDGFALEEPKGVLTGLKEKDFDITRALRIEALKEGKKVRVSMVGGEEAVSPTRKELLLRNPHTLKFCEEWKLLGCGQKEKEIAFPTNPLEQPGMFEKMRPIYNALKKDGSIPNARPDITFADEEQNRIMELVKKVWEKEQPELPFPTNFFLNFWQLMACNKDYETKDREAIMTELAPLSEEPDEYEAPASAGTCPGMLAAFEECKRKEAQFQCGTCERDRDVLTIGVEELLKNQFAAQNQKAEGVGMYNADTPIKDMNQPPHKRRRTDRWGNDLESLD